METRATKIHSSINKNAIIRVIPGHFATNHSHINYYVDMTIMKCRKSEAAAAAAVLARKYSTSTYIDTIICMDGCEVIGAYLADELSASGIRSMNQHKTMYVVTPEMNPGGQLIFRDNMQFMIQGKHCLVYPVLRRYRSWCFRYLQCEQGSKRSGSFQYLRRRRFEGI